MSNRNRSLNSLGDIEFAVKRIEELETKLAKAVTLAEKSMKWLRLYGADVHREASTLAELKGESHE